MMSSMEVSLYPLGVEDIGTRIYRCIEIFRKYNLAITTGTMSTVITGESNMLFRALQEVYETAASMDGVVIVVKLSNVCPVS